VHLLNAGSCMGPADLDFCQATAAAGARHAANKRAKLAPGAASRIRTPKQSQITNLALIRITSVDRLRA
jgi:hypothetical protein